MMKIKNILSEQSNTIPSVPLSMSLTIAALGSSRYWNERMQPALQDIQNAINSGEIYNTRYKDAVSTIKRSLEKTLEVLYAAPYTHGRGYQPELEDLSYYDDLRKMKKATTDAKLAAKAAGTGHVADAVKSYLAVAKEYAPIQDAIVYLKDKVKSGREPKPVAAPKNPDQTRETCAWCLRNIAHDHGKLAHHGFTRPGDGYQTASCPGIRYKPLEQSTEGLEARIQATHNTVKFHDEKIKSAHTITKFTPKVKVQISPNGKWPKQYKEEQITVDKSHPDFPGYHAAYVRDHEKSKKWAEDDAEHLTQFLSNWKAAHPK